MLPATRQLWHSRLYYSRSCYSIKRPRRDARPSWPSWPRPSTASRPSNPFNPSPLAPQIRLLLTIVRLYKLYLLTCVVACVCAELQMSLKGDKWLRVCWFLESDCNRWTFRWQQKRLFMGHFASTATISCTRCNPYNHCHITLLISSFLFPPEDAPCWLWDVVRLWFDFDFGTMYICSLLVYIVSFRTYPFFFTFSLLIFSLTYLFIWEHTRSVSRCGGIFNIHLTTNLPWNLPVRLWFVLTIFGAI